MLYQKQQNRICTSRRFQTTTECNCCSEKFIFGFATQQGFISFHRLFRKPFFHTAIKCNFSHRDKNVYQNESTEYGKKMKTWKWNYSKWACPFSCNFKGAGIREQNKKKILLPFGSFTCLILPFYKQSDCFAWNIPPSSPQITWLLPFFFSPPKQAQVELALLSVSVLTSSGMPRAREKTGGDSWVLKC